MDGLGSKRKGSRFERQIAEMFSKAFGEELRRVPASGGLDIKADLYNPHDDTFPYFIECKNRKTYRLLSLMNGTSELFKVWELADYYAAKSYQVEKYKKCQVPVVVFKGGDFSVPMAMHYGSMRNSSIFVKNNLCISLLTDFLRNCDKERLNGKYEGN